MNYDEEFGIKINDEYEMDKIMWVDVKPDSVTEYTDEQGKTWTRSTFSWTIDPSGRVSKHGNV